MNLKFSVLLKKNSQFTGRNEGFSYFITFISLTGNYKTKEIGIFHDDI